MTNTDDLRNGWTQYQKLVVGELERHENNLKSLEKEIKAVEVSVIKLEGQIMSDNSRIETQLINSNNSIVSLTSEIKLLNQARENQNLSINQIKWKITAFAAGLSVLATFLSNFLIKFGIDFLKNFLK